MTFASNTFASLGLTQGTYVYSSSNDAITVRIGTAAAVPEAATWMTMIAGFGMIGAPMRRRSAAAGFA